VNKRLSQTLSRINVLEAQVHHLSMNKFLLVMELFDEL
jgi:hypothetical protein